MGEAIFKNDDRVLWDEVKKMTKTNNKLPNIIDDHNNPIDITNVFSDKYKTLYNSVGYKINEMRRLTDEINSRIDLECADNHKSKDHSHTINVKGVMNAIDALKQGKKEENGLK